MNQKYYNYNDIEQMREKARKIDQEYDKKTFLKTMNPQEQKMALFFTKRPYEIINYLSELNYKDTDAMLNELTSEEIIRLLEQFTAEDKRLFYTNFSNNVLVNKFIANDKQAFHHVDKLNLERKIELLDSSKQSTITATEKIYDTLSNEEKNEVESKIISTEGALIVDNLINNNENYLEEVDEIKVVNENEQEIQQEENLEEEKPQNEEEVEKNHELVQDVKVEDINKFLNERLEYYKKQIPEFKDNNSNNLDLFNSLPDELKEIVLNDFNLFINKNKKTQEEVLNEFKKSKEECELEVMNSVLEEKINVQSEEIEEQCLTINIL